MITEQHFAVRYTSDTGTHLTDYETDEATARAEARPGREDKHVRAELLTRKVTYGTWRPARQRSTETDEAQGAPSR